MEIKIEKKIELTQSEITHILICHLQDKGILKNNIHISNINIREENGQIKCTIKDKWYIMFLVL